MKFFVQQGRDFLESSTIHGLVHISTGKNALVRCIWAIIVVACFSYDVHMIESAFRSWAANPVVTSVDTKPIGEVILPEITICPPPGTNTALNLDLVTAEQVELDENQRENLTLVAVETLHNTSINMFIDEQASFHTSDSIFDVYSGLQKMTYAFTAPAFSFSGVDYPESFFHETTLSSSGAFKGSFSTLGWGDLVTKESMKPTVTFTYTALISPLVFNADSPILVLQLESYTEEDPLPFGNVPSAEAAELVEVAFDEEIEIQYDGAGYVNFTQAFDLDVKKCSFAVKFSRSFIHQELGTQLTGISVSWFVTDALGNPIVADSATALPDEDSDNRTETFCSTGKDTNSEEEQTMPLTRWFNIFNHYYSVAGMDLESIWELVRRIKVQWLWKEDNVGCDSYNDQQLGLIAKGNLEDYDILDLLNDFDEDRQIDVNATMSKESLPDHVWLEGFRMFAFIAYCPSDEVEAWAKFYEGTIARSPARGILQKVAQIFNRRVAEGSDPTTEAAVYTMLAETIPFKAAAATLGLSSEKELLGQLDSPLLGPVKESLVCRICSNGNFTDSC